MDLPERAGTSACPSRGPPGSWRGWPGRARAGGTAASRANYSARPGAPDAGRDDPPDPGSGRRNAFASAQLGAGAGSGRHQLLGPPSGPRSHSRAAPASRRADRPVWSHQRRGPPPCSGRSRVLRAAWRRARGPTPAEPVHRCQRRRRCGEWFPPRVPCGGRFPERRTARLRRPPATAAGAEQAPYRPASANPHMLIMDQTVTVPIQLAVMALFYVMVREHAYTGRFYSDTVQAESCEQALQLAAEHAAAPPPPPGVQPRRELDVAVTGPPATDRPDRDVRPAEPREQAQRPAAGHAAAPPPPPGAQPRRRSRGGARAPGHRAARSRRQAGPAPRAGAPAGRRARRSAAPAAWCAAAARVPRGGDRARAHRAVVYRRGAGRVL